MIVEQRNYACNDGNDKEMLNKYDSLAPNHQSTCLNVTPLCAVGTDHSLQYKSHNVRSLSSRKPGCHHTRSMS